MAHHQARTMAMDPPHITEFASERYFEKLSQLNAHQHQRQPPPTRDNLDASTSSPSRFILPLRETKTADVEPLRPLDQKRDKSRFFGLRSKVSILHSKSSVASGHAPRVSVETPQKR
jgi:hypothetical protein